MPGLITENVDTSTTTTLDSILQDAIPYENINVIGQNHAVVINLGSTNCSAGLANDSEPRTSIPTAIGWDTNEYDNLIMRNNLVRDEYFGNEAYTAPSSSLIDRPIRRGIIRNSTAVCSLLDYVFEENLEVDPEDAKVLLTGSAINSRHGREILLEYFFESLNINSICLMLEPVLTLYASGRTTGLVVKCGGEVTSAIPIYEGNVVRHAAQRSEIGGNDIINFLRRLLQFERGYGWTRPGEYNLIRDMAHSCTYIDEFRNINNRQNADEINYMLPDGTTIKLRNERYLCGDVVFNPLWHGHYCDSIQDVACAAIASTNINTKRSMIGNIVMSGQTTLMQGFSTRFVEELTDILPGNSRVNVNAVEDGNRIAWFGGAIYAGLARRRDWFTKQDYEEVGFESPAHRFSDFTFV